MAKIAEQAERYDGLYSKSGIQVVLGFIPESN
jgi:hypothetical protein